MVVYGNYTPPTLSGHMTGIWEPEIKLNATQNKLSKIVDYVARQLYNYRKVPHHKVEHYDGVLLEKSKELDS